LRLVNNYCDLDHHSDELSEGLIVIDFPSIFSSRNVICDVSEMPEDVKSRLFKELNGVGKELIKDFEFLNDSFAVFAVLECNWKLCHSVTNVFECFTNVRKCESLLKVESDFLNVIPNLISVCDAILNWVFFVEKTKENTFNNE